MIDFVTQGQVPADRGDAEATHETADIDGRRVWATAGILAATIVLAGFMAAGALSLSGSLVGRPLAPINPPPTKMPSPPLLSAPSIDLRALRAEKHALLTRYAWIDRAHGVVRIPIERAMSLLVARGEVRRP
jgi:hypothetical protein